MTKMTKEQTVRFNTLFDTVLNWGEGENCIGMFEEFGGYNEFFATCVEDGYLEIMEFDGNYYHTQTAIPVNSKTKTYVKKLVSHLIDKPFETFEF